MQTFSALALIAALAAGGCTARAEMDTPTLLAKVRASIGTIETFDAAGEPLGFGTGFFVGDEGQVATNFHVIEGAERAQIRFGPEVVYGIEGVLAFDEEKDLALLKAVGSSQEWPDSLPLAERDLAPGSDVVAIGSPLGLEYTVTTGTSSGYRVDEEAHRHVIQHTASINPGSSGGPLLSRSGEVVGVNTYFLSESNDLYFAVPSAYIETLMERAGPQPVLAFTVPIGGLAPAPAGGDPAPEYAFTTYRSEDLELAMPVGYRVERAFDSRADDLSDETSYALVMVAAPQAERAELNGWLSDGLRLRVAYPPKGRVWTDRLQPYEDRFFQGIRSSYATILEETEPTTWQVGSHISLAQQFHGTSPEISDSEMGLIGSVRGTRCWARLEVAVPKSKQALYEAWLEQLAQTFRIGCLEEP